MKKDETKKIVREGYAKVAKQGSSCCSSADSCGEGTGQAVLISKIIGYTDDEIKSLPEGANLGLGCGNPTALAGLKAGETVLDLGSGAGIDCFLAAEKVGDSGKVIGVDMTHEMIEKARENTEKNNIKNVEFRLGEIENLPVADNSVDVVISNCVLNLSPEKQKVFRDIYRVLKPGGRIAISDIALLRELPEKVLENIQAYVGCVSGAVLIDEYKRIVKESGLKDIEVTVKGLSDCIDPDTNDPVVRAVLDGLGTGESLAGIIASIYVEGIK